MNEGKMIRLNLGSGCNMNCPYCYEKNRINSSKIIEDSVLDTVIDYCKKNKDEDITIIFFGGEPTLYPNKIEYILNNLKSNKNVKYSIFTNGTNNDYIKYIINVYKIELGIIMSNKNSLPISQYGDIKITQYNIIMSPYTLDYIDEKYLKSLREYKNLMRGLFVFDLTADWENYPEDKFIKIINKINTFCLISKGKFTIEYFSEYDNERSNYINCTEPCLNVDTNGDVVFCHRYFNIPIRPKGCVLGNIVKDGVQTMWDKVWTVAHTTCEGGTCYFYMNLKPNWKNLFKLILKTNLNMYAIQSFPSNNEQGFTTRIVARCGGCSG